MIKLYVDMILKGMKTIDDVPKKIREKVRAQLPDQFKGNVDETTES